MLRSESSRSEPLDVPYLVLLTMIAFLAVAPILLKVALDHGQAEVELRPITTLATSSNLIITGAVLPLLPLLPYFGFSQLHLQLINNDSAQTQLISVSEPTPCHHSG